MKTRTAFLLAFGLVVFSTCKTSRTPFKTLDYLYSISGKYTVSGQHNKEPNAEPDKWTREIYRITASTRTVERRFLFQEENIANRSTMISEARKQWRTEPS